MLFNPLEIVNQAVVLCAVVVVGAFMIKHWDRVLIAITGDDRLHGTCLDCIHFTIFKCCGTISGEFRCFRFPCCPRRNVCQDFARLLGVKPYTIQISNIVIGDLPFHGRGDFYITAECAANPPMVTSLQEEKQPKAVHFPESLTLRLRWSPLEEPVRITVKELDVLGSTDLCYCHVSPMKILHWIGERTYDGEPVRKRVEMKAHDASREFETPPWILLQIEEVDQDFADLERFLPGTTVKCPTDLGHYDYVPVKDFKSKNTLLDASGHAIQEPLEEDLECIERLSSCMRRFNRFLLCIGSMAILICTIGRLYVGSCYRKYKLVTMAQMLYPEEKAFSIARLKQLQEECKYKFTGTGQDRGVPCRPDYEQVLQRCHHDQPNGLWPADEPEPTAFADALGNWVGFRTTGLPCWPQFCEVSHYLRAYDVYFPFVFGGYIFAVIFCRCFGQQAIRWKLHEQQRERTKRTKAIASQMKQKSGWFSTFG